MTPESRGYLLVLFQWVGLVVFIFWQMFWLWVRYYLIRRQEWMDAQRARDNRSLRSLLLRYLRDDVPPEKEEFI